MIAIAITESLEDQKEIGSKTDEVNGEVITKRGRAFLETFASTSQDTPVEIPQNQGSNISESSFTNLEIELGDNHSVVSSLSTDKDSIPPLARVSGSSSDSTITNSEEQTEKKGGIKSFFDKLKNLATRPKRFKRVNTVQSSDGSSQKRKGLRQ